MNIIVDSNHELTIELVLNIDYEQMTMAILKYFKPDYISNEEITSWYEGFAFYKDNISVFYYNYYDLGDDNHRFEIKEENAAQREHFKNYILKLENYLKVSK